MEKGLDPEVLEPERFTIGLDFDGTIHSYKSGFHGKAILPDLPVDGAIAWLSFVLESDAKVIMHTCRLNPDSPSEIEDLGSFSTEDIVAAIKTWLVKHGLDKSLADSIEFWSDRGKPHCNVYLDDRGYRFDGFFPSLSHLKSLEKWYETD